MSNKEDIQLPEDKLSQYLKETREYIQSLKNDLFKKILSLQENKNQEIEFMEFSQNANTNT